ncbi:MAG: hypothetical protein KKD07_06765 [Candidatus Omnitrophica bacterium]|nr:hypothetical protein [Candidatus Omnitrophota bacterium]MBU1996125.1 hypothetical protein [Candidatus Omnitrophota bacterium]MBU4334125.1 hypothetical protein [Candidatus Omnitrophota bacterium]
MRKYVQILLVSIRNPAFLMLLLGFIASSIISKLFIKMRLGFYANEMFTVQFVFSLWLCFMLGLVLKRQFANHRASILPGYRAPHLVVAFLVFVFLVMVVWMWEIGTKVNFEISSAALFGVHTTCLFMAVFIVYLGFLSIGAVLVFAYLICLLISGESFAFVEQLSNTTHYNIYIVTAIISLLVFMVIRLMKIKEDSFEYPFLLSWTEKALLKNQIKASNLVYSIFNPFKHIFKSKRALDVYSKYPRAKSTLMRSIHWDIAEYRDLKSAWILIAIGTPVFVYFLNAFQFANEFFANAYSNFLLLSIAPVLIALGANYKKMMYWEYDSLKPIDKKTFILEKGYSFFRDLVLFWMLFVVYFAVISSLVLNAEILTTVKFWSYLFFTGTYGYLIMAWISYMSSCSKAKTVIFNGMCLCLLTMILMELSAFDAVTIIVCAIASFVAGIIMLNITYARYCDKELGIMI